MHCITPEKYITAVTYFSPSSLLIRSLPIVSHSHQYCSFVSLHWFPSPCPFIHTVGILLPQHCVHLFQSKFFLLLIHSVRTAFHESCNITSILLALLYPLHSFPCLSSTAVSAPSSKTIEWISQWQPRCCHNSCLPLYYWAPSSLRLWQTFDIYIEPSSFAYQIQSQLFQWPEYGIGWTGPLHNPFSS